MGPSVGQGAEMFWRVAGLFIPRVRVAEVSGGERTQPPFSWHFALRLSRLRDPEQRFGCSGSGEHSKGLHFGGVARC